MLNGYNTIDSGDTHPGACLVYRLDFPPARSAACRLSSGCLKVSRVFLFRSRFFHHKVTKAPRHKGVKKDVHLEISVFVVIFTYFANSLFEIHDL